MPTTTTETTLLSIDREAQKLGRDWIDLVEACNSLQATIEAAKRAAAPAIRRLAQAVQTRRAELAQTVAENPHLFDRPRSQTMHGWRIGIEKGRGKVTWADDERVVELITRHMGDRLDDLVRTKRTPDRAAIGKMSVTELRLIGCSIAGADDQIVVRPVATDAERLVAGFLDAAVE